MPHPAAAPQAPGAAPGDLCHHHPTASQGLGPGAPVLWGGGRGSALSFDLGSGPALYNKDFSLCSKTLDVMCLVDSRKDVRNPVNPHFSKSIVFMCLCVFSLGSAPPLFGSQRAGNPGDSAPAGVWDWRQTVMRGWRKNEKNKMKGDLVLGICLAFFLSEGGKYTVVI